MVLCSDKSDSGNNDVVKLKTTYTKIIHIVNTSNAVILKYSNDNNNNNNLELTNIIVVFGDIVANVDSFEFVDE